MLTFSLTSQVGLEARSFGSKSFTWEVCSIIIVIIVVVIIIIIIIIIIILKEMTCILTDVAIAADRNVVQKEAEKKLKYKSLGMEI